MPSKNANGESYGKGRTRNYTTVVYPDSAPENWQQILSELCIPSFLSPLHEYDVDEATGEIKKAHWHVMLMFSRVKTKEQAKEVFDQINGVGCEAVKDLRSCARYLCHLDHPHKYKYRVEDVVELSGADYRAVIALAKDRKLAIREMVDYCREHKIYAYCDLFDYAMTEREDWFDVLADSGTYVMKEYLKSMGWKHGIYKTDV